MMDRINVRTGDRQIAIIDPLLAFANHVIEPFLYNTERAYELQLIVRGAHVITVGLYVANGLIVMLISMRETHTNAHKDELH